METANQKKNFCTVALWLHIIQAFIILKYNKNFVGFYIAVTEVGPLFSRLMITFTIVTDTLSATNFFQKKILLPEFWNTREYMLLYNLVLARISDSINSRPNLILYLRKNLISVSVIKRKSTPLKSDFSQEGFLSENSFTLILTTLKTEAHIGKSINACATKQPLMLLIENPRKQWSSNNVITRRLVLTNTSIPIYR